MWVKYKSGLDWVVKYKSGLGWFSSSNSLYNLICSGKSQYPLLDGDLGRFVYENELFWLFWTMAIGRGQIDCAKANGESHPRNIKKYF